MSNRNLASGLAVWFVVGIALELAASNQLFPASDSKSSVTINDKMTKHYRLALTLWWPARHNRN